jgi:hypothetical protein
MDMKSTLIELGERLVRRHKFSAAKMACRVSEPQKDTTPVVDFLLWLDKTPEARQELESMGLTFIRTAQVLKY